MKRLLVLTLLVAVGGCASSFREKRQANLRHRASFDLACAADQIELTPLDRAAANHGAGTTGVSGCGKRATYVWDAYRGVFIMNNASERLNGAR